jgi:hypothetical protein
MAMASGPRKCWRSEWNDPTSSPGLNNKNEGRASDPSTTFCSRVPQSSSEPTSVCLVSASEGQIHPTLFSRDLRQVFNVDWNFNSSETHHIQNVPGLKVVVSVILSKDCVGKCVLFHCTVPVFVVKVTKLVQFT